MRLSGSEIIISCLKEQGVDTIFGYPGGSILNVYDALYKHPEIRHILSSHEQGAAHMADGYARSTGKTGVCIATSGPGATNLVTGIATAYMDSVPLVAVTCNVFLPLLGKDSFQEVDIAGIVMPITKYSCIVKDVKDLASAIRRAFYIAKSGRPGPVLVDVTKDVTAKTEEYLPMEAKELNGAHAGHLKFHTKLAGDERAKMALQAGRVPMEGDLDKALEMLLGAKRPVVFVGGGAVISGAKESLKTFVDLLDAPVCDTLMGKGTFDGNDLRYTGMLGMHGTKASNISVSRCDLLIALGVRFSDRVTGDTSRFAQNANILHIDIDPAEINKNVRANVSLVGDLTQILERLNERLKAQNHSDWVKEVIALKDKYPLDYNKNVLTGPGVIEAIYQETKGDAIITTDVGQHQMWAAQFYKYSKPRTFLSSGGLGTMGYGLGACIGAKTANPDRICINIAGDGCFRMNMQELATASRYDIPIIQVILNNHVLGMVRQWQTLFYEKRYSHTVLTDKVDFVKVSEGLGCMAERVSTIEEAASAIRRAIKAKAPYVIECMIHEDDKVFPMVPAGKPIEDAFDGKDLEA